MIALHNYDVVLVHDCVLLLWGVSIVNDIYFSFKCYDYDTYIIQKVNF